MKPALIVIDVQNGWLELSEGLKRSVTERITAMSEAISIFRKACAPIIFTYHSYAERGIVPGTKEFELIPSLTAMAEDAKVIKTHQNAFVKTALAHMIRDKGCDTVILIGLSALNCVLATYLAAYDEGFFPYIVRGAVAGPDEESVQIVEKICDTLSLRAVAQILGQNPRATFMH
ncbi:MAG: isochorismatase family cysteine hydrolase [Candidatus Bathyarchaeia archaeon]|jgi:nicotinamidase-related amidase